MTAYELEQAAQRAAEIRLAAASDMLFHDEEGEPDGQDHPEWDEISAPYCGCDTCIVREVIDAAWPYLKRLAAVVESADTPASKAGPEMGTGSSPVGGTHSDYEEVQRLRRAIMQHRFDYTEGIRAGWRDKVESVQTINRKLWNAI